MPGVKAEISGRVDAIIEIAQMLVKQGHKQTTIEELLIKPIIDSIEIRMEYGVMEYRGSDAPKERDHVTKKT
ncbi:hypothetical protein FACS189447_09510 [Spirochaetia bacterium]|nr:hypothetical protein FACS189447_09510 [Spirochaetia bacterium]